MAAGPIDDLLVPSTGIDFSGIHMNLLETRKLEIQKPVISETVEIHNQPFVIGQHFLPFCSTCHIVISTLYKLLHISLLQ